MVLQLYRQPDGHVYDGDGSSVSKLCPALMTPWTVACQAPLSVGFSQARTLEWVAISSSRDPPDPGIKPTSLVSPELAGGFFITSITWEIIWPVRPQKISQNQNPRS